MEHSEGDLESVKIRQPNESYDTDIANLLEFCNLLVRKQINFSIEFFTEPLSQEDTAPLSPPSPLEEPRPSGYMSELEKLKEDSEKGRLTKKQYRSMKDALLRKWRERVEGGLSE